MFIKTPCPSQIQLQSRRTGAVLTRRMKDFEETLFAKLAQNNIQYWHKHHRCSSRHFMRRMKDLQYFTLQNLLIVGGFPLYGTPVLHRSNYRGQVQSWWGEWKIIKKLTLQNNANHAKSCKITKYHAWYSWNTSSSSPCPWKSLLTFPKICS